MPDENKQALVEMLAEREIPLIEDDIHGELYFGSERPIVCKSFDRKGLVLLCTSYSKDLSPGYRVGWIAPGRYKHEVERIKMVGTSVLPQLAIAQFLDTGGYDHHLRRVRQALFQRVSGMSQDVLRYFPDGSRVSSPVGGNVIWVQLPDQVDALALYRKSLKAGITIAPGHIFSATPRYRNFIRLNAAYYSDSTAWAVRRLGELVGELV
jgi:DNA-binding transcriptional MocR family regulator